MREAQRTPVVAAVYMHVPWGGESVGKFGGCSCHGVRNDAASAERATSFTESKFICTVAISADVTDYECRQACIGRSSLKPQRKKPEMKQCAGVRNNMGYKHKD